MKFRRLAIPLAAFLLMPLVPRAGRAPSASQGIPVTPPAGQASAANLTGEQLGDLYMARKDYKEAADAYKALTEKSPGNAVYHNKLGMAYQQLSILGPAAKSYERAIKVDPKYADAMNNLGTIWYTRKKYGKAIRIYKKGIAIRPEMAVLHSNLGYAYFAEKNYEESIASFRKALTIDPQFFEHSSSRNASLMQNRSVEDRGHFYFLLAKSFAQSNNTERCLHYLRKAREEGYAALESVKTDPAFSAVLAEPELKEILAARPADAAHP